MWIDTHLLNTAMPTPIMLDTTMSEQGPLPESLWEKGWLSIEF